MPKYTKQEVNSAREFLAPLLRPGTQVSTVLRHVSRSGMMRTVSLMIPRDGDITDISWHAARLLGWPVNAGNRDGIRVDGCGMDMGFHAVYCLSRVMFPHGFNCVEYRKGDLYQLQRCEHCGAVKDTYREKRPCYPPGSEHSWQDAGKPYRRIGAARQKAKRCPANDHVNDGANSPYHHSDGGYALTHRWL